MASFKETLQNYLQELTDLRKRGASEDSIRDAFLRFLRKSFPRLNQADPIELEKHIPALKVRGGFADALFGDLIFEFKRRLDESSRADGHDELERYLKNQKQADRFFGILTDGETLEVYVLQDGRLTKMDGLGLVVERCDESRLWLDCYLFHEKQLKPSANDVALRFGERSPTFWQSLRLLSDFWRQVKDQATTQTKYAEWQGLLSIVYGSQVGDDLLFLRHTYLALFARILAFVALTRSAPKNEELAGIVIGPAFEQLGLQDFVEDDFFSWVIASEIATPAQGLLHGLATRLATSYDLSAIREDLLKELYQELVDPETRHDLGEFYTPDWLAELTLEQAGFPPKGTELPSVLDPSCGSGTFLFTAVRLMREAGHRGQKLVDFCSHKLAGLDIHPLAITIAKTNVLLALGKDLGRSHERVTLRIFMADTLAMPQPALRENVIRIPVDVEELAKRAGKPKARGLPPYFDLPDELADAPQRLDQAIEALVQNADSSLQVEDAQAGFSQRLAKIGLINGQGHVWHWNLRLMRWLLEPPATDSVWRFILRNAYQPELLARQKFDFVVGNPPWLSYRYLKRLDYQQRIRQMVFKYNLLGKRQAHLFTQMELATLFFVFCADRYLRQHGVLAFVMPRSVLTGAKQHTVFQEQHIAQSLCLIDCEQVIPLFNVPACVVIRRHEDAAANSLGMEIPLLHTQGVLPSKNVALTCARQHLKFKETTYKAKMPKKAGSPYLKEIIQGASLAPRCTWFVRPPEHALVVDKQQPQLVTDPAIERQAKKPWKGQKLAGPVEAEFLFATLLSDNMLPFGWRQWSLVVLPYIRESGGSAHLLDADAAFRHGSPLLGKWLRNAERLWKRHRKSNFEMLAWINWQNKLASQHSKGVFKLLYNEAGTHVCSCVIDAMDVSKWRIHDIPVAGFIADYVTYRFETENSDEAHYLCAFLNSPFVDLTIKPFQTKGSFGAQSGQGERHIHRRPFEVVPIPRFDSKNARHVKLALLSRQCHDKMRAFFEDADERWQTAPIGRLRTELRKDHLAKELSDIDGLAKEILR